MSASSSSSAAAVVMAPPKYDVFLSFRGADTRNNFTDHLHAALCRKEIETFIDYKIDRGNEISSELYTAIEESMIYVIIFSQNYPSSSWCLNELVKILECKKKYVGRHVIPVFYKVDPSTVRHQKQSYSDAFLKHHEKRLVPKEEIQSWKDALKEAADLSGTEVKDTSPETKVLDDIVEDILTKLNRSSSSDYAPGMVGIDEHISQIQSMLQLESVTAGVRIIGIWGMGGIGKTTLARALYDKLRIQFSSRSLVENAQQEIDRDGTRSLRQKYLSELGLSDERLKRAKVLFILDDVNKSSQIKELIGGRGNFRQGSRIIVTSRDRQVLKNIADDDDGIYQVKEMNYQDSHKLFNLNAFKQICPKEGYEELVGKFLKYSQGIPLALNVLGALLLGKKKNEWKSQLEKLEKFPEFDIFNVLKLSYDGLDREQKDIFLDIACFYVGYALNEAKVMDFLDACGFSADMGMDGLKDRGLISINSEGYIKMHDLIQEMGREIVRKECSHDPGKRSRLWKYEEINQVLRNNKGTDAIQCIYLNIYWSLFMKRIELHPENFKRMPNLRMLNFKDFSGQSSVALSRSLESLPDGLKILHWNKFPQKSLPVDFYVENLVILNMQESYLEQLWDDNKEASNLKRLDLRNSLKLTRIPDFSLFPKVEEIILSGCKCLTSLPVNFCKLKSLKRLDLSICSNLKKFPEIEEVMENLAVLNLGCSAIQELPSSLDNLVGLKKLNLYHCSKLEIIPPSIGKLTKLCELNLYGCKSLKTFPSSIFKLKLTELNFCGCSMLETFPEILERAESFTHIDLFGTTINELPSSLEFLVGLQTLSLGSCRDLESLPNSIVNLSCLTKLDCSGCYKLTKIPNDIGRLSSLKKLSLKNTRIANLPESIGHLSRLESLDVRGTHIDYLPESIAHLSRLKSLDVSYCRELECIPQLPPFLERLIALDCPSIKRVSMPNSRVKHPSEGTFELYFTNKEEQDPRARGKDPPPSAHSDFAADARVRITKDAYRSVFYCSRGSTVPS